MDRRRAPAASWPTDGRDLVQARPVLVLEHDHVRAGLGDPAHQGGAHRRPAGQREVLEDPGHRPQQLADLAAVAEDRLVAAQRTRRGHHHPGRSGIHDGLRELHQAREPGARDADHDRDLHPGQDAAGDRQRFVEVSLGASPSWPRMVSPSTPAIEVPVDQPVEPRQIERAILARTGSRR